MGCKASTEKRELNLRPLPDTVCGDEGYRDGQRVRWVNSHLLSKIDLRPGQRVEVLGAKATILGVAAGRDMGAPREKVVLVVREDSPDDGESGIDYWADGQAMTLLGEADRSVSPDLRDRTAYEATQAANDRDEDDDAGRP